MPYHASIRLRLGSGAPVKDKDGNVIGIRATVKAIKNKVAVPFKTCEFEILFGRGISEHTYIFDRLNVYCKENSFVPGTVGGEQVSVMLSGDSSWKTLMIRNADESIKLEKKFYKEEFLVLLNDKTLRPYIDIVIDAAYTLKLDDESMMGHGDEPDTDEDLTEGETDTTTEEAI